MARSSASHLETNCKNIPFHYFYFCKFRKGTRSKEVISSLEHMLLEQIKEVFEAMLLECSYITKLMVLEAILVDLMLDVVPVR